MNQITCLKSKTFVAHGTPEVAAKCCYKEPHKYDTASTRGSYQGHCAHKYLAACGRTVPCDQYGDVPWHVRKPLGAYKPHKYGASAGWKPQAWTGPVPRDIMARYCDDGALAARLCEQIAASLVKDQEAAA